MAPLRNADDFLRRAECQVFFWNFAVAAAIDPCGRRKLWSPNRLPAILVELLRHPVGESPLFANSVEKLGN